MTDLNEMTADEHAKVLAAIHAQQPVRMRRLSDGRTVTVAPDRVAQRIGHGYELVDPDVNP
jgi:exosome complex RNA-binding protein Rrp4